MRGLLSGLGVVLLLLVATGSAAADTITFDESGNGWYAGKRLTKHMGAHPNFPNLNTLYYDLPFNVGTGDVPIFEPPADAGGQTGVRSDILSFFAANQGATGGTVYVLSGPAENGEKAVMALETDISGLVLTNVPPTQPTERGPDNNNYADYSPDVNQAGRPNPDKAITYHFVSDGLATPEPSSLVLLSIGAVGLAGCAYRRCRRGLALAAGGASS
jgi:hypothetical protein